MTSTLSITLQKNGEHVEKANEVKESKGVTTIQKIYREDNENLILRDPTNRRSFINRSAYARLHRSLSTGNKRHSVDNLKGRFENLVNHNSEPKERSQSEEKEKPRQPEAVKAEPEVVKAEPVSQPKVAKAEPVARPEIAKAKPVIQPRVAKTQPVASPEVKERKNPFKEESEAAVTQPVAPPEVKERKNPFKVESEVAETQPVAPPEVKEKKNPFKEELEAVETQPVARPEVIERKNPFKEESEAVQFTPASFGYPKTAKLVPPLIKPKPVLKQTPSKDENSNLVKKTSESSDAEEIPIILRKSESGESIDKIAKELSNFTMDGKSKERKRANSFKKLFMGGLFGKDKKKKEEERTRPKYGDNVYNDNIRNESNFNRQSPQRQTVPVPNSYSDQSRTVSVDRKQQEIHEEKVKELEQKYAELHVNRFNQIRQTFTEERAQDYVPMDNKKKPSISDYISAPVSRYIDTSSTASTESEKPRDTPPRAQETYQNFKLVKPKASIPINSERSLPNPYQNEKASPRTIERNLNKSNSKDYPDKASFATNQEDTYGTVFDSLEYAASRNGEIKPINSPKSPSFESTKLKLPPNREIYEVQPRVRSPIPSNRVSTDKIIATELLKNTRSPTPPKRTVSKLSDPEIPTGKPPISPKAVPIKPSSINANHADKIVTNALVHAPRRAQTPLENRNYSNVQNFRASTPVDLRMSAALKLSPQKEDIRKSVEEYYWKELKKLKEEEDYKLYSMQMMNGYYDEAARIRRSRSLSPSSHRGGRRSLSLPRDARGPTYVDYGRVPPQQPIPEGRTLITDYPVNRQLIYDQNFVRNASERRSVDSLQRPIFKRGSLTKPEIYENQSYNKRVSFSNSQTPQVWPTRNGFTQSPPQRRLDRMESELDDEVFAPNPPMEPVYGTRHVINEPLYSNRVLEQFRAQQAYELRRQQQMVYGQIQPQLGPRRLSMDSIPRPQDVYVTRSQVLRRPVSNIPPPRDLVDDYGRIRQYPSNPQLALQRNPVYSSRQSMTDSNYGQKQVFVRNKFCDIYGQIHDTPPQSGIMMGRLRDPKMGPSYTQPASENFVRGSRLTASANDIGKRYGYDTNEKISNHYDNRPLPPPPQKSLRNPQISDTESGSDASEIQRIMQSKSKSKKRGFFGK